MTRPPDDRRLDLLQGTLDMLILRTLQWGPRHGPGIGQAIRAQSDDLLRVETGSLYPALHRLVRRGWLKAEWGISEANQRAKYYRLTATGKAQLVRAIGLVMNPEPGSRTYAMMNRRASPIASTTATAATAPGIPADRDDVRALRSVPPLAGPVTWGTAPARA